MYESNRKTAFGNGPFRPVLGTILLVDDEEIIRQLGVRILERSGYRVITARDGAEGIEIYRNNSKEIDVIILDVSMPEMDGMRTMLKLREEFPEAKILISTGQTLEGEMDQLASQGMCEILMKPYRAQELTSKVRAAIAKSI